MADETATTPENTQTPEEEQRTDQTAEENTAAETPQAGAEPIATAESPEETPAPAQTAPVPAEPRSEPAPAAPTPSPVPPAPVGNPEATSAFAPVPAPAKPRGPAPTPAAFAKKTPHVAPAPSAPTYSEAEIKEAETFGRVDDRGNVFVKEGETERQVGQFPHATKDEALNLYARRFLDIKEKLDLFAARLKTTKVKPREIDESIRSLGEEVKEPDVVGNIPFLRTRLEDLTRQGQVKKEELAEARKAAMAKAIEERTAIVVKAEELANSLDESTNWRSTADKFRSLFEEWQNHQRTTIRIDKTDADALWKRFSSARTTFNQARRKWAQQRDSQRADAKRIKEEIIAQADKIKDSTDWGTTSHEFNELMDRWKQAGRAGRQDDDQLWARFRQAADVFFDARQADRDKTSVDEKDNLAKKEALLTKAEALLPVKDVKAAKQARQALASIQEEWDQIGYVPRYDVRRIEGRMDAVDREIKSVEDAAWNQSDPEADARVSSFEEQLTAQLDELNQQIAAETDPDKKRQLETEKATKEQWLNAVK